MNHHYIQRHHTRHTTRHPLRLAIVLALLLLAVAAVDTMPL